MSNSVLKIGFIGGGLNSSIGTTHKIASQMDGRWKLISGCFSAREKTNKETAATWDILPERTHKTWKLMLEQERGELDAIAVLTPTPSHLEIVTTALELGYAVICEKTLAISPREAIEINNTVKKHNSYLAVIYNYTGYPMVRELRTFIREGHFGRITQINIEMPQESFLKLGKNDSEPSPQQWRLHDNNIPIIGLDLGTHVHQLIDFLSSERPLEVVAMNNSYGFFPNIVDNTVCMAKYSNNLDAQIWFSKSALGNSNGLRIRVYGDVGSAEWYQLEPDILNLHDNKGKQHVIERSCNDLRVADQARYNRFKAGHPTGFIEAFGNYYYDLADDLRGFQENGKRSSPWVFGGREALEGLLFLEAISKSSAKKSWINIG
ncbi:Gfo/Idh/MocA family oxidoreductase [Gammaproteobacteria bacterium]|nr:Gfo/Idh/MocA family oxidoreductase [Gammaproteobacteria bacterium]